MKLKTHLHIAETLHKDFEGHLNKFVFKAGNIIPDLWPPLRIRSHYECGSGDFVNSRIKSLLSRNKGILIRSLKLGVIAHYTTDFSCTVHKPQYRCSSIDHYIYEKRLTECHETGHRDIDEALERVSAIIHRVLEASMPLANMA